MNRLTAGLFAAGLFLVAAPTARALEGAPPQTDIINKYIADGWQKAGIKKPAEKATDLEFMRRVFVDLIGRIPTVEEVIDFEKDPSTGKRAKLVRRLLHETKYQPKVGGQTVKVDGKKDLTFNYAEEYSQHWANIWTVWLMSRSRHHIYLDQMRTWLEIEFMNNTGYKDLVTKLLTATGDTNKNGAVNFIVTHLGEANPADKRAEFGPFDAVPITSRITRLFLGLQTQCVQCHDHPFNKEWVQGDFWGVNAFFRQTLRDKTPTGAADRRMQMTAEKVSLKDDPSFNGEGIIFYERRDGKLMATKANFLKDYGAAEKGESQQKTLAKLAAKSRREALAEYVTKHDNFNKAFVNRIWGHLFGRGMNKEPSIDDFGSNNEIIHPEMLDALAAEFGKYYDCKMLLEWVCCSDAYSLSHVANKDYVDPKYDAYFARMPLKAMSPEVLFEALMTATKAEAATDADARKKLREDWMSKLVRNFGDDEGNEITFNGTVVQALLMMNGKELNGEIDRESAGNPVRKIFLKHAKGGAANSRAIIDDLFLATLSRHPSVNEIDKIAGIMNKGAIVAGEGAPKEAKPSPVKVSPAAAPPPEKKGEKGKKPPASTPVPTGPRAVPATGPNDLTFYQDLFWALVNTNEFMLNH
jgi:hypothetical protein